MTGWSTEKLGALFRIKHGYAFKGQYFSDVGSFIVLTPGNFFDDGGFKHKGDKEKYYSGPVPDGYVLDEGDLILAMTEQAEGLLGSAALVPSGEKYLHNQRLGLIVDLDKKRLDKIFLYYLFNTHLVRTQIRSTANGAKVRHTSPSRIYEVEIRLPPLRIQRRIASILSAYDDLIENNTRRIAILEEMARRLYEEWFVQFRFPGHEEVGFKDSELGRIPEGWDVKGLYDVADVTYGHPFKAKEFNDRGDGLGAVRIRDIRGGRVNTFTTEKGKSKHLIENGDILVGMDGQFHMGKWAGGQAWLVQRVARFQPKESLGRYLLFLMIEQPIRHLEQTIVGTTVAHLSASDLKAMQIVVPSDVVRKEAMSVLEPMYDLEIRLRQKNANLRAQRDLLLPKLVSGEIDVSDMPLPGHQDTKAA